MLAPMELVHQELERSALHFHQISRRQLVLQQIARLFQEIDVRLIRRELDLVTELHLGWLVGWLGCQPPRFGRRHGCVRVLPAVYRRRRHHASSHISSIVERLPRAGQAIISSIVEPLPRAGQAIISSIVER